MDRVSRALQSQLSRPVLNYNCKPVESETLACVFLAKVTHLFTDIFESTLKWFLNSNFNQP
jgi:hypothetical protein